MSLITYQGLILLHRIQSRFRDNLRERIALKVMKPKQCETESKAEIRIRCEMSMSKCLTLHLLQINLYRPADSLN